MRTPLICNSLGGKSYQRLNFSEEQKLLSPTKLDVSSDIQVIRLQDVLNATLLIIKFYAPVTAENEPNFSAAFSETVITENSSALPSVFQIKYIFNFPFQARMSFNKRDRISDRIKINPRLKLLGEKFSQTFL